jgi:hypothetical protein
MMNQAEFMHASLRLTPMGIVSRYWWRLTLAIALILMMSGCSLPRVNAEDRLFLDVSLEFLDAYELPQQNFEQTPVGGLSAIVYDREGDRFYVLSDDRSAYAPARFYTMTLDLNPETQGIEDPAKVHISNVNIQNVTFLRDEAQNTFPQGAIDPEGMALSPRGSLFIANEGVANTESLPSIDEFDLETGKRLSRLPIPERYIPAIVDDQIDDQHQGIRDNRGFESLTLSSPGFQSGEPFRVFTAIEESLHQDVISNPLDQPSPGRFLHYVVGDQQSLLISEHLYPIDPRPSITAVNGLVELLVLDQGGHFLSLERSLGLSGYGARIFQVAIGGATDTSAISSFSEGWSGIQPIHKRLLMDLSELGLSLENLEGMTLGPRLPDGAQSLLLISDDNFHDDQATQILLFRLRRGHS